LNSVKRRLYLLFARNDLVEVNKEKNSFVVVIRIPATEEPMLATNSATNLANKAY